MPPPPPTPLPNPSPASEAPGTAVGGTPRRRVGALAAAGSLLVGAVAVVALMGSDPGRSTVVATGDQPAGAEAPPPTVGAPRASAAPGTVAGPETTTTTLPLDVGAGVDASSPTTAAPGSPVASTVVGPTSGGGPAVEVPGPTGASPTSPQPSVPAAPPPTAAPATAPPPTAAPTTRYVPQFGEVEFDYDTGDGVTLAARNANPSIPVGGRAYWTNHTDLTDLELIVNGASAGFLAQHRSTRLTFDQPGTFTWAIAGYPGLTGTVTVG